MRVGSLIILIISIFFLFSFLGTCVASSDILARLWQFSPASSGISATQVIEDISGDGHQDIFVATTAVTSNVGELPAELLLVNGRTGTVVRSLNLGRKSIGRARYLGGTIIIWEWNIGLKAYSTTLTEIWNKSLKASPTVFSACDSSRLLIAVDRNVSAIDVMNGNYLWTWRAPAKIIDGLPVADGVVCYYAENIALLNVDGVLRNTLFVARPPSEGFGYTETLHQFNASSFFFFQDVVFRSSDPTIRKIKIDGGILRQEWKIDIGGGGANKPLVITDVDGDQVSEFMCVRKEDDTIAIFSGRTGDTLYSTSMAALYISSGSIIDDIDGDGIHEVAFGPYTSSHFHGLYLASLKEANATLVTIASLDIYDTLISMEDVDGDGLCEIIGVTVGGDINCYQGFDPCIPEFSSIVFFGLLCLTAVEAVLTRSLAREQTRPENTIKQPQNTQTRP